MAIAAGLWIDGLVRVLFARADWLGWAALALAAVAGIALLAILIREFLALSRLRSVARLQALSIDVLAHNDPKKAQDLVSGLVTFLSGVPHAAEGRGAMEALKDEVIDGPDLAAIAERELLEPLDREAVGRIRDAAARVSVVTAVSPRALFDIGYVVWESTRTIRAVSTLYGGRPGVAGFWRLVRNVIAHLAVTGTMAAGDTLAGQLLGHGLASRISARLGEGVVNGMMTARIGIAAMEASRPMPFHAVRRPRLSDIVSALGNLATGGKDSNSGPKNGS